MNFTATRNSLDVIDGSIFDILDYSAVFISPNDKAIVSWTYYSYYR